MGLRKAIVPFGEEEKNVGWKKKLKQHEMTPGKRMEKTEIAHLF